MHYGDFYEFNYISLNKVDLLFYSGRMYKNSISIRDDLFGCYDCANNLLMGWKSGGVLHLF